MKVQYDLEGGVYGQSNRFGWIYKIALAGLCLIVLMAGAIMGSLLFQRYYERRQIIEVIVEDVHMGIHSTERDHESGERTTTSADYLQSTTPLNIDSGKEHDVELVEISWDSDGLTVNSNRNDTPDNWALSVSMLLMEALQSQATSGVHHGELSFDKKESRSGPEYEHDSDRSSAMEMHPTERNEPLSVTSTGLDGWIPAIKFRVDDNEFTVRFGHSESENSEDSKSEEHRLQYRFRCEDGLLRPADESSAEGESLDLIKHFTGQKCKWNDDVSREVSSNKKDENENHSDQTFKVFPEYFKEAVVQTYPTRTSSDAEDYYSYSSEEI